MAEKRKYCPDCGGDLKPEVGFAGITWIMCQSCRSSLVYTEQEIRELLLKSKPTQYQHPEEESEAEDG